MGIENAALNRHLANGAGVVLDLCGFKTGAHLCSLEAEAACERGGRVRVGRVKRAGIVLAEHLSREACLMVCMIGPPIASNTGLVEATFTPSSPAREAEISRPRSGLANCSRSRRRSARR